jgi:hypothetical protein
VVLMDGRQPPELRDGPAHMATATLRLPAERLGQPIACLFNEERITARAWPAAEGRIAVAEMTW